MHVCVFDSVVLGINNANDVSHCENVVKIYQIKTEDKVVLLSDSMLFGFHLTSESDS